MWPLWRIKLLLGHLSVLLLDQCSCIYAIDVLVVSLIVVKPILGRIDMPLALIDLMHEVDAELKQ